MTSHATYDYDVFLSYAARDRKKVEEFARRLKAEGLKPFFDQWDLVPGEPWQEALEKAMQQSRTCAVFVGPHRLGPWQNEEVRSALAIRVNDDSRRVIPVLLPDASVSRLPLFLARLHAVSFHDGLDDPHAFHQLVSGIKGIEPGEGPAETEPLQPLPAWPAGIRKAALLSSWSKPIAWLTLLLAILMTMAGVPPEPPRPSVAVLTFENQNQSKKEDIDWLSTALADAVSAKLGLGGDVRVVNRSEVSFAEMDLRLETRSEISAWDLHKIRGLLGVELVLGGVYERKNASSPIRLALTLYDARDGHVVARTMKQGLHWLDLANLSTEDLPDLSHRQKLESPPQTLSSKERLRGLFPGDPLAAQLYFQGLARYRSFDFLGATGFFGRSAEIDPHPLVLARLADMYAFLGRSEEAQNAIQKAIREAETRKTSQALPERYRREIDLIEREVASDTKGLAEKTYSFFRDFFPDDLSYGFVTAQALIEAGSIELVKPFLQELRLLPLAENHPFVSILEADALFVQKRYREASPIASQAIEKARALEAVRQEGLARLQLASILDGMGCNKEAVKQLQLARAAFDKTGDPFNATQCLELTALYYDGVNLSQAKDFYEQAIRGYDKLGAHRKKEQALLGLKAVLLQAGLLSDVERASQEADGEDAIALLQESNFFYLKGDMANARRQVVNAKRLGKESGYYAAALTNLAEIELMEGHVDIAEDHYIEALNINEGEPSEDIPYNLVALGRVYMLTGEYSQARLRLDRALQWLKVKAEECSPEKKEFSTPDSVAWYEAHLAMAELETLSGHAELSEEPLRQVLEWARREEFKSVRSRAFSLQARRLLDERRSKEAEEKVDNALQLATNDFRATWEARIASALVRADRGEAKSAVNELYEIAKDSADRRHVIYELESRLLAGEIELRQLGQGRERLEKLRDRAIKLNFGQIVQRVDSVLKDR